MKKHLLCHAILISMLGMGQAWADPTESASPEGSKTSTVIANTTLPTTTASATAGVIPTDSSSSSPISSQENGIEQIKQSATEQPNLDTALQMKASTPSMVPTVLGGLGLVLGLIALIYSWRVAGKVGLLVEGKKKLEKKLETELMSARKEGQDIVEKLKSILFTIQKLEAENASLKAKIETLENELKAALNPNGLAQSKTYLLDGELSFDNLQSSTPEVTPPKMTDQDILDGFKHLVHNTLSLPQGTTNVLDFKAELERCDARGKIATYLLLDNTLMGSSIRYFDALVLFLVEPLSNGANTLVYLRKDTIQHSSISFIFEGVRDGAKIIETQVPAQLKQLPSQQIELQDDNIVQKGQVLIG